MCFHDYRQPRDTTLESCFELEQFGERTPASSVPGPDSHLHNSLLSQSNLSISAAMLQYLIKVRRVSVLWENTWIGYNLRTLLPLHKLPISVFHAWGGEGPVNNDKEGKRPNNLDIMSEKYRRKLIEHFLQVIKIEVTIFIKFTT